MKKKLLNFINCPVCKRSFELKVFLEENDEIKEGLLLCSCGQTFPIVKNIPRILVKDLKNDKLKRKTSESFGYEWQKFSKMLKEWKKNFKFYFEPLENLDLLKDKIILEVGCGNGRHTYYAAKIAKEIIAIDLSQAVDIALYNNRNIGNTHFIQSDIYSLPFRENSFDFIFSIGVLHHLPAPEQGFRKLIKLLKGKGGILVYVYHSFARGSFNFYVLKCVSYFRRLTTNLPHRLLYLLCYPIAILSYLIFVFPYKIFFKKRNNINWPLRLYSDYPFKVLLNDTFDRFSAPIENRYTKEEILGWYKKAGLKNIKILEGGGWRIFGIKS